MRIVRVYKSLSKPDMYLYVDYAEQLSRVPAPLLDRLGETTEVLTLKLTAERKLARANAGDVLDQIEANGFYLQLPPAVDEALSGER